MCIAFTLLCALRSLIGLFSVCIKKCDKPNAHNETHIHSRFDLHVILKEPNENCALSMFVLGRYVCMYVCMHVCVYAYVCMCACMYVILKKPRELCV